MRKKHPRCADCFYHGCVLTGPCPYFDPVLNVEKWSIEEGTPVVEKDRREFREAWLEYVAQFDDDFLLDRANDEFEYK